MVRASDGLYSQIWKEEYHEAEKGGTRWFYRTAGRKQYFLLEIEYNLESAEEVAQEEQEDGEAPLEEKPEDAGVPAETEEKTE